MTSGLDDTVAGLQLSGAAGEGVAAAALVAKRYQIVRWLGGGGMGRVYAALDTELDELVALKVLRSGLAEDAIERFRREVKLTRKIMHPNVARMFDIGEHDGDKFLTMELVEGTSLAQDLGKPMTWERVREIGLQVCAGLGAAHAAGVIHRDLKPDNVLVEAATGRLVITDFGIARTGMDANVTRVGEMIGTPRYMAPEQLACEALDARADLFAFGVMLYELITGQRPWSGDTAVAVAVAQATKPLRPIGVKVPPELAAIVEKCLRIDPTERPGSAAEIATALEAVTPSGTTRPSRPSLLMGGAPTPSPALPPATGATTLAVLQFSAAPGDEYLAEGVREDLIDTLSTTESLRVRPAGVVAGGTDPRAIGRALEVDHVVVGSLRRGGDKLRVTARLVGVADGFQIWARRTDCTEAEILAVSDGLAADIAAALSTRAISNERPIDPRAVDLYLRARAELRRYWGGNAITAANLLEEAVAIAPNQDIFDAYAYACAQAWAKTGRPELFVRAKNVVEQAIASRGAEACLAAAVLAWALGDSERMATHLGEALVRAPMSAQGHEFAGRLLVEIGSAAEARKHFEIALGLEPQREPVIALELARLAAYAEDWATVEQLTTKLSANPDPAFAQIGALTEARLSSWRRDLKPTFATANRITAISGALLTSMVEVLSDFANDRPFNRAVWDSVMHGLAHSEASNRVRLVTYQRAIECAAIVGHYDEALDALTAANQVGLIDINWLDDCPLFRAVLAEPAWQAQRAILSVAAERVLLAFREASHERVA